MVCLEACVQCCFIHPDLHQNVWPPYWSSGLQVYSVALFSCKKLTLNLTLQVVPCGVREGEEVRCRVFMRTVQTLDSKSVFCCSLNTSCMPSDQRVNKPNTKYRAGLRQLNKFSNIVSFFFLNFSFEINYIFKNRSVDMECCSVGPLCWRLKYNVNTCLTDCEHVNIVITSMSACWSWCCEQPHRAASVAVLTASGLFPFENGEQGTRSNTLCTLQRHTLKIFDDAGLYTDPHTHPSQQWYTCYSVCVVSTHTVLYTSIVLVYTPYIMHT